MRENIEYLLVLFFIKCAKFMPKKFIYYFLDKVSLLLFYTLKSRRNLAISNLANAFKNLDENEIKNLAKETFRSLAKTVADCLLLINKRVKVEDFFNKSYENEIKSLMQNVNTGVLFFTAHFGNWEILTKYVAKLGFPQLVISREGNNTLIEKNITIPFRDEFGNKFAYKDEAMNKIVKALKKGEIVGILTDLKLNNSILVPFFGRECYTAKTVGSLYLKYHPKIIPIFARRIDNGKYEIIVKEFPNLNLSGDKENDIKLITKTCNEIYEDIIKQSPEQWFWMHNRWKLN
ncbi:lysophospholipid acyltransferase family protein [Campylobacter sp. RM12327]|uniref:lysophospholipid acyltransferase family protein n=1 Tax=Campylobacter sputorum TaxID=206 RepID=UPI000B783EE3|nr:MULTISPECIES: lysophospholipid acyltransferase family protein [Campylobacter]ASM40014.1 lipid A biosynthesis lauroyl acyltransferase [Campylobacter sputorum]MBE7358229.1 lysophospholipid acyltransferase family protein [Campylobacter sp. RM11302]MBF6670091.1 lysophospholipid acyltransferase family protein [Campylobacter sp. RM12327]MBF6674488.1 lysophospholipid acyltransferase family protein [Campylobacter sp. RM13538]MBF6676503.1 lysophospholipid acyltransferase family protein [Campylobacte